MKSTIISSALLLAISSVFLGCYQNSAFPDMDIPELPMNISYRVKLLGNKLVVTNFTQADGFYWDFGNGTTSDLKEPDTVVYGAPGTYTLTLTATKGGQTVTESQDIQVRWKRRNDFPGQAMYSAAYFPYNDQWFYGLGKNLADTRIGEWWSYDPASDVWSEMGGFPIMEQETLYPNTISAIGQRAYLFASKGFPFQSQYYFIEYDMANDTWNRLDTVAYNDGTGPGSGTPPNYMVYGFAYNGHVYLVQDDNENDQIVILKWLPGSSQLETVAEVPCPLSIQSEIKGRRLGNQLYLIGSAKSYVFNLDNHHCRELKGFADESLHYFNILALPGRGFLALGGNDHAHLFGIPILRYMASTIWQYDPGTQKGSLLDGQHMPYPNQSFALLQENGFALMLGGKNQDHLQEVWEFHYE